MSNKKKSQEVHEKTPLSVIQRRLTAVSLRQGYIGLALRVLCIVVIFWLIFSQVFLITQAKGQGMFPAVKDGDLVLAFRLQREYMKDDVIVYEMDGELQIGRIVGCETDVVTMDDSGTLLVNGTAQTGEILFPTYAREGQEYPYRVPDGYVFVLGDYRTEAEDSRDFGPIPMSDVKGKVITILRRREL